MNFESSSKSSFSPRLRNQVVTKTPASILKKRVLVERHVKITPKSKKQLQFSFSKTPRSGSPRKKLPSKSFESPVADINSKDAVMLDLIKFRNENEDLCISRDTRRKLQKLKSQHESTATTEPAHNLRRRISAALAPSAKTQYNTSSTSVGVSEPGQHVCIHNYRLSERLFAEPIIADENGRSLCPICQHPEPTHPTEREPHFVRVSIPPGIIKSPIRVRPHRKKSFDPSDSYALSKHCLAGYAPPKHETVSATSVNYDLMSSAFEKKCHVTVTTRDLQKMALRDRQVAEHRELSLGKRAAFNQSLNAAKRLQRGSTTKPSAPAKPTTTRSVRA